MAVYGANKEIFIQGSLDEELEKMLGGLKTPTGLPMETTDPTDSDLRRDIQREQLKDRRIRITSTRMPMRIPFADQQEAFFRKRPGRRR